MTSIKLTVTGAKARVDVAGLLTSGMAGIPVTIEYDNSWEGLNKNLVCMCRESACDPGVVRTILNVDNHAVVAHEVMLPGRELYLGIEGCSADGKLVEPSTWAYCGKILPGANADADPSTDSRLSVWAQLQADLSDLSNEVDALKGKPSVGNADCLPEYSEADNGKVLGIVDGSPAWVEAAVSGGDDTPVVPATHGIVWDLVNVTSSNPVASVNDGASLTAVLTPAEGYTLGDVTVTMGGEVLTGVWNADTATVTIASVTGDVIISCAGAENAAPVTETLGTIKIKSSGWPTFANNGDGSYTMTINEQMSDDPTTHANTVGSVYWTMLFPGTIPGGELAVNFNKPVTSGAIEVAVFAVDASAKNAFDATKNWVWVGSCADYGVAAISANTTLQMPDGTYPLVMVRNKALLMEGDESASHTNVANHIIAGDITFTVTGNGSAAEPTTLSVDDDYAMDYGISTLALVTDESANTKTGIDSAYAAVIEEAKNAWMLAANGDMDKIPLMIHTDQHGHLNSDNPLFSFISEIVNWYDISKVINLGDTVSNWIDSDPEHPLTECAALESYLEAMADVPFSKRIEIFGNHDTWDDSSGTGSYTGLTPQNYLYKYFRNIYARRADNYGNFVVRDDNYNIKYVVVSGFAYDPELGGYTHYVMRPDSIRWAIAEMEKADGYDVILLSHVPLDSFTYKDMDALWSGRKAKTSGTATDEYGNSYAFDFTNCDGELLCALHGHNHEDGNAFMGDLLYAWFDGMLNANACHFLLVDRANRQLNVWKVDDTPQCQNYQIPLDKPAE